MRIQRHLFFIFWVLLAVFLIIISFRYKSRSDAMVAVVESQITAISYQKPVVVESIHVAPGQEIKKGDTILVVSRPDLALDIEKIKTSIERYESLLVQEEQDFLSKKALIEIETEGKVNRLKLDKLELDTKMRQQKSISEKLRSGSNQNASKSYTDSLLLMKIRSIEQEIQDITNYKTKEVQRLRTRSSDEQGRIEQELVLVRKEMDALRNEYSSLIRIAGFDGIVGTVNVQLDELLPPFKTVLSIFEVKPTLIKAYMNESITYDINPGDRVSVVSENRQYEIAGVVLELGARITSFPEKIQESPEIKSYGQEVFIRIPTGNNFLNGEKVFVYPAVK